MSDDADWFEIGDSPTVCTEVRFRDCADGSVDLEIRQRPRDLQAFLDNMKAERELIEARGWKDGAIVGRVPDAYYHTSGMAKARLENDQAWIKRFYNDPDHRNLRLKEGRL